MSALEIEVLPILEDNYTYLLRDSETGQRAVVDPGDAGPVLRYLRDRSQKVDIILSTHRHADHVAGNLEVKAATGAKVVGPAKEASAIPGLDRAVAEGDVVSIGSKKAVVIETPGHTAGHISFWFEADQALFPGDTLFALGCGRLFEGDAATMWHSLGKLAALPPPTRIYCGHEYTLSNARFALTIDPTNEQLRRRTTEIEQLRHEGHPTVPSSLAQERMTNPFLRADDPAIRQNLGMAAASDAEVFGEIRRRKDRA